MAMRFSEVNRVNMQMTRTFCVCADLESVENVLQLLADFGVFSGSKLNREETATWLAN